MILIYKIEYSEQANNKQSSMSGQYETTNTANKTANKMFTEETSEFGMHVFSDPYAQATYKQFEDDYKKKYALKRAYDKQQFLHKMRVDLKREYLTRNKQVKHLQKDAAIEFRNAEMSLQEHYASAQAKPFTIRAIDISAPLVSRVTLPTGEMFDLETFEAESEFIKVAQMHDNLRREQEDMAADYKLRQQEQQQEEEARRTSWWGQSPSTDNDNERELLPCWDSRCTLCGGGRDVATTRRSAFGGCYDDYDEYQEEQPPAQTQQQEPEDEEEQWNTDNEWGLPLTTEEIEILECGAAAELQMMTDTNYWVRLSCHTAAERASSLRSELRLRAMSDEAREALTYDTEDEEERIRQYEVDNASYQQHLIDEENAAMVIPDVAPVSDEHASAGGVTLAVAKAKKPSNHKKSAASATKARITKQHQQHQQQQQQPYGKKKFVPIQVTIIDNRGCHSRDQETSAILSASKVEINLPKKHLQNATREAKKRHDKKWNRINAAQKQSNARGTTIANLPGSMECMSMSDRDCY